MAEFVVVGGLFALSYMYGGTTASKKQTCSQPVEPVASFQRQRRVTDKRKPLSSPPITATKNTTPMATWGDGTPRVMGRDVQPFYRGSVNPGNRAGSFTRSLGKSTGSDPVHNYRPPRGQRALFKPTSGLTNLYQPNRDRAHTSAVFKQTMQSIHKGGEQLADPIQVAPGLGVSIHDDPSLTRGKGGFHQFERNYLRPKTIDDLRAKTRPRTTFAGRTSTLGASYVEGGALRPTSVQGRQLPISVGRTGIGGGGAFQKQRVNEQVVLRDTERGHNVRHAIQAGPAVANIGVRNYAALPAPVRRTGATSITPHNQVATAALPGAPQNRDTTAGVEPRDTRTHDGRVGGAKNTTGGMRSYADMYNATLSELRGQSAPSFVPGTTAVVPASNNRSATNEVVRADRASVLQGRTAGAQHDGPRLENSDGEKVRERRGIPTSGLTQIGHSLIPVSNTETPSAQVGPQPNDTFVVHSVEDLNIASSQLSSNPLHVVLK